MKIKRQNETNQFNNVKARWLVESMKSPNKCYKYPQRETDSLLGNCKANHRIFLKLPSKNTKKSVTSLLKSQKWNR